jgi:hypothetical protein
MGHVENSGWIMRREREPRGPRGEVDEGHMAARERWKGGLHEGRRAHSWLNTGQMRKVGLHEHR